MCDHFKETVVPRGTHDKTVVCLKIDAIFLRNSKIPLVPDWLSLDAYFCYDVDRAPT